MTDPKWIQEELDFGPVTDPREDDDEPVICDCEDCE